MENSDSLSPQLDTPHFWDKFKNTRNFLSAVPNFLLALAFMFPSSRLTKFLALSRTQLGDLMEIEFIVIHSFPFIVMFYFWEPEKKWHQRGRVVCFWGLLGLYIMMTSQTYGFWGLAVFCSLTMATYLGFFLHLTKPRVVNQLVIRWAVNFAIYMLLVIVLKMPENIGHWPDAKNIYPLGAQYFIGSALVEWTGFTMRIG